MNQLNRMHTASIILFFSSPLVTIEATWVICAHTFRLLLLILHLLESAVCAPVKVEEERVKVITLIIIQRSVCVKERKDILLAYMSPTGPPHSSLQPIIIQLLAAAAAAASSLLTHKKTTQDAQALLNMNILYPLFMHSCNFTCIHTLTNYL